ncbi:MAG: DUF748 domain-containing protein [Acidobacteria bacterium]|nr:DUF748 domain-containing protein [Acidobacteriota bacterium]
MAKVWLVIAALVIGAALTVIFLLPFFLNADSFRPTVEAQLSSAFGRTVTMGRLTFSLVHGSLVAEELAISDDPDFSNVPFLQAKSLDVSVDVLPLLMNHEVHISGLTIDSPSIQLIEHTNGKWNYSGLTLPNAGTGGSDPPAPAAAFRVKELKIVNGSALVSSIPQTAKPFEYSEVNLTLKQFSSFGTFPFELSAKLPGSGTVSLTGEAGPIAQSDVSKSPFHGTIQLREFNPVLSGLIEQAQGIAMNGDVDGEVRSDGVSLTSSGKIKASQLQLAPKGMPSQNPVDVDYSVSESLATRDGIVSDVAIHAGSTVVHARGSFKASQQATMIDLHLSAPGVPVGEIEPLLPILGVRLPSGSSLQGGALTADMTINGPATAATVSGPVEIDNSKLVGFDLSSKIVGLNSTVKSGSDTDVKVLKAKVNSTPQETRISEIYAEVPGFGTANGEGTVALTGALDFKLTARLGGPNPGGPAAKAGGNPKAVFAPVRTVTLTLSGTAANPTIEARNAVIRQPSE